MLTFTDLGHGAHFGWARVDELAEHHDRALALLSPAERERYDGTASLTAAEGFLWGRMLLRELVGRLTDVPAASVAFDATCPDCGRQHGKPRLKKGDLAVSVSHSPGVVAVAAAWGAAVGVDVEPRSGSTRTADAITAVAGASADPLRHWTRIEAVLKADGRGLRVDPRTVAVARRHATVDGVRYRLLEPTVAEHAITVAVSEKKAS
ncbi:4'-phosphopantetheinyl transferase [Homoserinimonas aerilata]|uniref:4'-phosphopantetheinyl transferase n=1 Tax=Homoserinimonas aerilata TaxID=1162970 RepID=A0A542YG54_9MICO|nr:hypothetical protein [Homoserinimonas aerilata]TQL47070.1 4'-phosphopantetheinyl transferase [Homoserinimonas aerilata]